MITKKHILTLFFLLLTQQTLSMVSANVFDSQNYILAMDTNDSSYCKIITDNYGKDYCFSSLAIKLNNISYCENINSKTWKNACYESTYSKAARTFNDISYCNKLKMEIMKDFCYKDIATNLNDTSYCIEIQDKAINTRCNLDFNKKQIYVPDCKNPIEIDGKYICPNQEKATKITIKETDYWPFIILIMLIVIIIGLIILTIQKIKSYSNNSAESNQNIKLPKFQRKINRKRPKLRRY